MGVAVHEALGLEKSPRLAQPCDNARVGVEYSLTCIALDIGCEPALSIHGRIDVEPVAQPHLIVFLTVPRGGVNTARPRFERDMVSENDARFTIDPRMPCPRVLERGAGELR